MCKIFILKPELDHLENFIRNLFSFCKLKHKSFYIEGLFLFLSKETKINVILFNNYKNTINYMCYIIK